MERETSKENKVSESELALINEYSRKELKADEVYTFSVVLCDNDIDRDNEHFSDAALDKLAELFVGVTGIYDHDPSAKNQIARIYSCKTETLPDKLTSYGAPYKRVVAKAYVPVCKGSEEFIAMLDSGIKKEVSVGCGVRSCTCSICGEDMRVGECSHVKGKTYGGELCCGILDDPTDAYEWSFIAVPAQRKAGVIKSFLSGGDIEKRFFTHENLDSSDIDELKAYISSLKTKAEEGERYKSALRLEAVKAGITAKVGIESALLESMVKGLSVDELLRLKSGFEREAEKHLPIRMQTKPDGCFGQTKSREENNGFRI